VRTARFVPLGAGRSNAGPSICEPEPLGIAQKRCYTELSQPEACSELIQVEGKPNAAREGAD
jgi:hypothetical protein